MPVPRDLCGEHDVNPDVRLALHGSSGGTLRRRGRVGKRGGGVGVCPWARPGAAWASGRLVVSGCHLLAVEVRVGVVLLIAGAIHVKRPAC